MKVNFKNVTKCIILILFIFITFITILNIRKIEYYKSIIKEKSVEYSYDDNIYIGLKTALQKYFEYIKDKDYYKVKDSSALYAEKSNFEYDQIATKLNLYSDNELLIEEVYKLDNGIFRCTCYTNSNSKASEKFSIVVKIDINDNFFNILDIVI